MDGRCFGEGSSRSQIIGSGFSFFPFSCIFFSSIQGIDQDFESLANFVYLRHETLIVYGPASFDDIRISVVGFL